VPKLAFVMDWHQHQLRAAQRHEPLVYLQHNHSVRVDLWRRGDRSWRIRLARVVRGRPGHLKTLGKFHKRGWHPLRPSGG